MEAIGELRSRTFRFLLSSASYVHIYRIGNLRLNLFEYLYDSFSDELFAIFVLNNVAGLKIDDGYDFYMIEYWWEEVREKMGCRGPYEPHLEALSCTDLTLANFVSCKHSSILFYGGPSCLYSFIGLSANQVGKSLHSLAMIV